LLRLPDKWVWDSWVADTGSEFHLFFLQAPRSLGEESLRHLNATVGHAVSADLRDWRVLDDALLPGPRGAWDDMATWTGSVIEHDGTWHLFYTGTTAAGDYADQRIGRATSRDLHTWERAGPGPVVEMDPRWYEMVEWDAWRDPWVLADPDGHGFHLLIAARANDGPSDARGVIGHAWSADLLDWEVRPPLSEPGEFGHLEVPQVAVVEGTPVLLFSVAPDRLPEGSAHERDFGSYLVVGETRLGPWDLTAARRIPVRDLYAVRLVRDRAGEWQVLGFRGGSPSGEFAGEIIDPIPLKDLGLF